MPDNLEPIEDQTAKPKRDWLLPISVLVAAVLIAGALIFSAGKKAETPTTANTAPADNYQSSLLSSLPAATATDHILGSLSAPIKIIEYSDLECPFCKQFQTTLQQIMTNYSGKVAWIFRNYPIPQLHPKAPQEAQAAECAAKLGGNDTYWKYIDMIFSVTPSNNGLDPSLLPQIATQVGLDATQFNACLNSAYGQDIVSAEGQAATAAGALGTPFSVVVLDQPLSASAYNVIIGLDQQYPNSPAVFQISPDKKMFTIGGAVPLQFLSRIFDAITKS